MSAVVDALGRLFRALLLLPEQASDLAARVDLLHMGMFVGFWAVGLALLGAVAWFVFRYRRAGDDEGPVRTERITAPVWLEVLIAGGLLAFFVGAWAVGFRQYTDATTPDGEAEPIYVTGKQWTWTFDYPQGRSTAGVLYLPANRPVRLLVTSRDVIHSFFVPEFRIKKDGVPGRYNAIRLVPTRTGRFRALCTEFCGSGHSRMWADVVVLPPERYDRWLAGEAAPEAEEEPVGQPGVLAPVDTARPPFAELARRGERVANRLGCLGCHTVDGSIHLAPTWLDLYGRREVMQDGDTVVVDAAYITESMMEPGARIVRGFGDLMPSFRGRVEPSETAAIIEYIRSLSREDSPNGAAGPDAAPDGDQNAAGGGDPADPRPAPADPNGGPGG